MKYFISLITLFIVFESVAQKKALIVSGGGARGAWGGGMAQYLVEQDNNDYDVVFGTSTGSLMAPLVAKKDFVSLKNTYTSVKNRDIFNVYPFKIKTNDAGQKKADIKGFNAFFRFLFGKSTFGETKSLRKLIDRTYTKEIYDEIVQNEGSQFIISVSNFTNANTYYFSSTDFQNRGTDLDREVMLDHIWRSSNQPLFMTLDCTSTKPNDPELQVSARDMDDREVTKGDCWVDAGIRDNIPLMRGIKYVLDSSTFTKNDVIDVIINNKREINLDAFDDKGILASIIRTIDILTYDVRFNDVLIPGEELKMSIESLFVENNVVMRNQGEVTKFQYGLDDSEEEAGEIQINLYFMSDDAYDIHSLDLYFNKETMKQIWDIGQRGLAKPKRFILSKEVAEDLIDNAVERNVLNNGLSN